MDSKCGFINVICGPMFSGKSTELIREIRRCKIINIPYVSIKPLKDTRDKGIKSHDNEEEHCYKMGDINNVKQLEEYPNAKIIFIEEAQMFDNLYDFVVEESKNGKSFYIAGLNGDRDMKPFGDIIKLLPICDKIIKLSALCKKCGDGTEANFTKAIGEIGSEQVVTGGSEKYEAVCRYHFYN